MALSSFSLRIGAALPAAIMCALVLAAGAAQAQDLRFEYAAKFVCGKAPPNGPVAPGFYFTAINVHNPSLTAENPLRKKFAIALPGEKVGKISPFTPETLKGDEAMTIDCPDIAKHLGLPAGAFVEGFAVIQSLAEFDVVAVYTAAGSPNGPVATMTLERVPKRP